MRFATIATPSHRAQLERLLHSLKRTHPNAPIDVFTDSVEPFSDLQTERVRLVHLPEIEQLGVKRAKFEMYQRAINDGPFIYLDADIVVLESLNTLASAGGGLTGCQDDLSGCPFIVDREFPWPGDPTLRNETYVNSGVLAFGSETSEMVAEMRRLALSDSFWFAHVFDDRLVDNHVLCAVLNVMNIIVTPVSEYEFNWQGFRDSDGAIAVDCRGAQLVHRATSTVLRLVHFAGIKDIDKYLLTVPASVAHIVNAASVPPLSPARAVAAMSSGASFLCEPADVNRPIVARVAAQTVVDAWSDAPDHDSSRYVSNANDIVSVALSVAPSPVIWNGLQCGGAYLEPSEYCWLRRLLLELKPDLVVETGAGETSSIFSHYARRSISLESTPGPWLDRARAAGADAHLVPFELPSGFNHEALESALPRSSKIDLLFIDSPSGPSSRAVALQQILQRNTARYVVIHDARRDAADLCAKLAPFGYVVADFFDSSRGALVFSRIGEPPLVTTTHEPMAPLQEFSATIEPTSSHLSVDSTSTTIAITNESVDVWPDSGPNPVVVSYHLSADAKVIVFDGARTPLPCTIYPGDTVVMPINVDISRLSPGTYDLEICLVQEGVRWFEPAGKSATLKITTR